MAEQWGNKLDADLVGLTVCSRFAAFLREYETPMETATAGDTTGEDGPQGIRVRCFVDSSHARTRPCLRAVHMRMYVADW